MGNGEERALVKKYLLNRTKTQPRGRTCGSVFKNPQGDYAGRLIETCGLKGVGIGGAKVSDKHANFIIADKNATAKDVKDLISLVKQKVKEKTGRILEEEIKYLGKFT